MSESHSRSAPMFSDDEVRTILERAAEMETNHEGTTLDDIAQSAAEAGLSAELVMRAAAQVVAERSQEVIGDVRVSRELSMAERMAKLAPSAAWFIGATSAGTLLGSATGLLETFVRQNSSVDVPSFMVLIAGGVFVLVSRNGMFRSKLSSFTGLMFGYGVGWAVINREVTGDLIGGLALAAAVSATISIAKLALPHFKRMRGDAAPTAAQFASVSGR